MFSMPNLCIITENINERQCSIGHVLYELHLLITLVC